MLSQQTQKLFEQYVLQLWTIFVDKRKNAFQE